jgi:putative membrane protein
MGVSPASAMTGEGEASPVAHDGKRLNIRSLFVSFITGLPQLIFPIFAAFFGTRNSENPMISVVAIVAILVISLFFRWMAWMRFRYYIGEHDIRIESGILSRNARSIPYDRIQDVSIEQKPLARMMGLGEVMFETGSGSGDDAKMSFVSLEEAARLRDVVRAHRNGAVFIADKDQTDDFIDSSPIFAMDGKRVFSLGLYSFSLVIFAVLGGLAQQFNAFLPFEIWDFRHWTGLAEDRGVTVGNLNGIGWTTQIIVAFVALSLLLFTGFATGVVRTLLKEYGFRLDRTPKGFRRRRGLLTLTDVVMPVHRVQAAVIETGLIRKRRGWNSLKFVSLAQDSKDESNFVAAPFATLAEIWPIANAAMIDAPAAGIRFRKGRLAWWMVRLAWLVPSIAAMMIFTGARFTQAGWLLVIPLFIGLFWWLEWRNYGDHVDSAQIYVSKGWWRQRLIIAPQLKVQTVDIAQGPISRRQGLASLNFGIAGGTLEMVALPVETAKAIRDAVMDRVAAVDYSAINRPY